MRKPTFEQSMLDHDRSKRALEKIQQDPKESLVARIRGAVGSILARQVVHSYRISEPASNVKIKPHEPGVGADVEEIKLYDHAVEDPDLQDDHSVNEQNDSYEPNQSNAQILECADRFETKRILG